MARNKCKSQMTTIPRKENKQGTSPWSVELARGLVACCCAWTVDDIGQKFDVRDRVSPVYYRSPKLNREPGTVR